MSSVDFHKCHGGEAAHLVSHAARHNGRDVRYSNRHIDPYLSRDNFLVGASRFSGFATLEMSRLRRRIRDIDKQLPPKRRRKDRVTEISYVIPAPEGLEGENLRKFFELVHDELSVFSGGRENVSCGWVHLDEVHMYLDPSGVWKSSRPHMHVVGIPFVEGKGVNGKQFETRERMRSLNRSIDERCRRELGVPFLMHEEVPGRTVEELKRESLDRLNEQISERTQELSNLRKQEKVVDERNPLEPDMSWMDKYVIEAARDNEARKTHREHNSLDEPDGR